MFSLSGETDWWEHEAGSTENEQRAFFGSHVHVWQQPSRDFTNANLQVMAVQLSTECSRVCNWEEPPLLQQPELRVSCSGGGFRLIKRSTSGGQVHLEITWETVPGKTSPVVKKNRSNSVFLSFIIRGCTHSSRADKDRECYLGSSYKSLQSLPRAFDLLDLSLSRWQP